MSILPLLLVLVLGLAVAVAVRTPPDDAGDATPPSDRLRRVGRTTRGWRFAGLLAGLGLGAVAVAEDSLGRGLALAVPLVAVGVLAGVIAGELRVRPPVTPRRHAELGTRRVRHYVPRALAAVVVGATSLFVVVLAGATAIGTADDLGRSGRALFRQCSPQQWEQRTPWPGSYYSLPLAVVVAAGLAVAALALHRIVTRPRPGEQPEVDDALRRQAGTAVTAACGLLVAAPLAGVAAVAGMTLLGMSCAPTSWTVAGTALTGLAPVALALSLWCVVALVAPSSGVPAHRAAEPSHRA